MLSELRATIAPGSVVHCLARSWPGETALRRAERSADELTARPRRPPFPSKFSPNHKEAIIAKRRSPETFEKRKRQLNKQRKRREKLNSKIARNAERKAVKDGTYVPPPPDEEPERDWRDDFVW